jgi:hypothetical protein
MILLGTWLPLIGWAVLAPGRLSGLIGGGLFLAAIASLAVSLPAVPGDSTPTIALPVLLPYMVAATIVVFGLRRRSAGWPPGLRVGSATALVLMLLVAVCGSASSVLTDSAPVPSSAELLPLPAPLRLMSTDTDCGATARHCNREFHLTAPATMDADHLVALVRAHLQADKG